MALVPRGGVGCSDPRRGAAQCNTRAPGCAPAQSTRQLALPCTGPRGAAGCSRRLSESFPNQEKCYFPVGTDFFLCVCKGQAPLRLPTASPLVYARSCSGSPACAPQNHQNPHTHTQLKRPIWSLFRSHFCVLFHMGYYTALINVVYKCPPITTHQDFFSVITLFFF